MTKILTAVYILLVMAVIPVARYILVFKLDFFGEIADALVLARIIYSGPAMVLIGLFLFLKYKSPHTQIGILSIVSGLLWIGAIIIAIVDEAA